MPLTSNGGMLDTVLIFFAEALVARPDQADRLVKVVEGNFEDDEFSSIVTKMVEVVKACNNDIEKALEKLAESTDTISKWTFPRLRSAWESHTALIKKEMNRAR